MEKSNAKISKSKGSKKSSKKSDSANAEKIKNSLLEKRGIDAKKNLYSFDHAGMNAEDQKKFRSSLRRKLFKFSNSILGIDRTNEEREESIKEFLKFYKSNWKINDFRIENFSQKKDESAIGDYKKILLIAEDFSKGGSLWKKKEKKGDA